MGMSILEESFKLVMGNKGVGSYVGTGEEVSDAAMAESMALASGVAATSQSVLLESLIVLGQEMEEGLGDKISSGWESVKAFIIKVFKFIVKGAMKVVDFFKKMISKLTGNTGYKNLAKSAKDALKKLEKAKTPKNVDKKINYKTWDVKEGIEIFSIENSGGQAPGQAPGVTMNQMLALSAKTDDEFTFAKGIDKINTANTVDDVKGAFGNKYGTLEAIAKNEDFIENLKDELEDISDKFVDNVLDTDEKEFNVIELRVKLLDNLRLVSDSSTIKNNKIAKDYDKTLKKLDRLVIKFNKFVNKFEKTNTNITGEDDLTKVREIFTNVQIAISRFMSGMVASHTMLMKLVDKTVVMIKKDITLALTLI